MYILTDPSEILLAPNLAILLLAIIIFSKKCLPLVSITDLISSNVPSSNLDANVINLRNNSQPDTTLDIEQSTFFIWSEACFSSFTSSCSVLAEHFSRTRVNVRCAAIAVARFDSFRIMFSNDDATSMPMSDGEKCMLFR